MLQATNYLSYNQLNCFGVVDLLSNNKYSIFVSVIAALAGIFAGGCVSQQQFSDSQAKDCAMIPREVVSEFSHLFYEQKQVRTAFETWVREDYIQHKPTLPDGREPVINFLENLLQRFPERTFTIHRMIAEGDLVAVHYDSQAHPQDLGFAVIDIFRVENCKMVEHWDVVQPVPETSKNENTMF